jgi:hypothetical protein
MFVIDCALKYYLLHKKKTKWKERSLFKKKNKNPWKEKKLIPYKATHKDALLQAKPCKVTTYKANHVTIKTPCNYTFRCAHKLH